MPVLKSIQRAVPGPSTLLRGEEKPQPANSADSPPPSCLLETCSLERINGISLFSQALRARTSTSIFGKRIWRLDKSDVISKRGSGAEGTTILLGSNKAVTTKTKKWGGEMFGRFGPCLSRPGHKYQSKEPTEDPAMRNALTAASLKKANTQVLPETLWPVSCCLSETAERS